MWLVQEPAVNSSEGVNEHPDSVQTGNLSSTATAIFTMDLLHTQRDWLSNLQQNIYSTVWLSTNNKTNILHPIQFTTLSPPPEGEGSASHYKFLIINPNWHSTASMQLFSAFPFFQLPTSKLTRIWTPYARSDFYKNSCSRQESKPRSPNPQPNQYTDYGQF